MAYKLYFLLTFFLGSPDGSAVKNPLSHWGSPVILTEKN